MALFEELTLQDALTSSEAAYYEKGNWSKMTWAGTALIPAAAGAHFEGFGTISGSYLSSKEFSGSQAVSYKRSLGSDVAERYWSLWLCYNNTAHSGYRMQVIDQSTTTEGRVKIYKVESGTEKLLIESASFTLEASDVFAFYKNGTTLEAWRQAKGSGAFTKLTSVADSGTAFTSGFIGIDGSGLDPHFTEFKNGTENNLLVGTTEIQPQEEDEAAEEGVAIEFVATKTGTLTKIEVHTGAVESTATSVVVGLYANSAGAPGTLLTHGTLASKPATNAWFAVSGLSASVVSGTTYWLCALALGGTLKILNHISSGGVTNLKLIKGVKELPPTGTGWGSNLVRGPGSFAGFGSEPGATVGAKARLYIIGQANSRASFI